MRRWYCRTGWLLPGLGVLRSGHEMGRRSPHERSDIYRVVSITGSRPMSRASWRSRANKR
jgi:hypothetical protein